TQYRCSTLSLRFIVCTRTSDRLTATGNIRRLRLIQGIRTTAGKHEGIGQPGRQVRREPGEANTPMLSVKASLGFRVTSAKVGTTFSIAPRAAPKLRIACS